MAKRAEAVNRGNPLLDQILDEVLAQEPEPVPGAGEIIERMREFQAYGAKKAKEAGLGLKDVTAVCRAVIKNAKK